jgi:hypothetical protein
MMQPFDERSKVDLETDSVVCRQETGKKENTCGNNRGNCKQHKERKRRKTRMQIITKKQD